MTQAAFWTAAGLSAVLTVVSAIADRARSRRRNLDRPGWVPWAFVQIVAIMATAIFAALAIMSR